MLGYTCSMDIKNVYSVLKYVGFVELIDYTGNYHDGLPYCLFTRCVHL